MNTDAFFQALQPYEQCARWVTGFSAGLDSLVLLHLLATEARRRNRSADSDRPIPQLVALHVDHGLHPESARWAEQARALAAELGIEFILQRVQVDAAGRGVEHAAREARYEAFAGIVQSADVLLLAHHRDDQIETMLLRLMRGAGPAGLAGMPAARALGPARLLRPLLGYDHVELEQYARQHDLRPVDDPSNADLRFDRNYLRHKVVPLLRQRWPEFASNWQHSSGLLAAAAEQLDDLAEKDIGALASRAEPFGASLGLAAVLALPSSRQHTALRQVVKQLGLASPPRARLVELLAQCSEAADDAGVCITWPGAEARRFGQRLYLLHALPAHTAVQQSVQLGQPLELPGVGQWCLHSPVELDQAEATVQFRQGGERIRIPGQHSTALKNWLQQQGVPPWLRARTPLLYLGDDLIMVGTHCVRPDLGGGLTVSLQWL